MNFNWITKNIALGTEFADNEIHMLVNNGIGAVLDLRSESYANMMKLKAMGIVYKRIPVMDNFSPNLSQFLDGVEYLDKCMNNGLRVYVHCMAGKGRSAVMVIAYLIKNGMAPIDAYSLVKERRPEANPSLQQILGIKQFERVI